MTNKKPGALFAVFLLLLCAGLTWFFAAGEEYYDYASGAIEGSAQAAPLDKDAIVNLSKAPKEKFDTEIKFPRGYFEISLALSAGEYKYVFLVDGKEVPDPTNTDRVEENGRTVCIKTVK